MDSQYMYTSKYIIDSNEEKLCCTKHLTNLFFAKMNGVTAISAGYTDIKFWTYDSRTTVSPESY